LTLKSLVTVALVVLTPTGSSPASVAANLWVQAVPEDAAEAAVKEALTKNAFGGGTASADALRKVSEANPGTTASGLARVASGLLLLDANRPADAIAQLKHPDVARTLIVDHALLGLARAQETGSDFAGAAQSYTKAIAVAQGPVLCDALFRGAEVYVKASQTDRAVATLDRAVSTCRGQEPRALLRLAQVYEGAKDVGSAAARYDRLQSEYATSPEAREAEQRLRVLGHLPALSPTQRTERDLKRASGLIEIERYKDAVVLLQGLRARKLSAEQAALVRVRLGQALIALGRSREAQAHLAAVPSGSSYEAEAAFHLAKDIARRLQRVDGYETVATRFPGTPWAEEALLLLANYYQKDALDEDAVPYWRRLLTSFPDGKHTERAAWRVSWSDYRKGRYEEAAQVLERTARSRPQSSATAGFLYWAGRARHELRQDDRARALLEETVRRFKNAYHGIRARETLAKLPPAESTQLPALVAIPHTLETPVPVPPRIRQLLLIERLDEASDELMAMPSSPQVQATLAWIESRRGRLRPAITAMKRAYPEYVGEAGDHLPEEFWRILYPLQFGDLLQAKSASAGLDPALVAAVICQESTFDAGAVSRAGARGLMQVMGSTGRTLARALGVTYRKGALHDPNTSLEFGTYYLKQMVDRFGGRVERALAAYNAGPHRVVAWTAANPEMSAEEFIESIPFTETRQYVMTILASQVQYRRIYSLPGLPGKTASGAPPS
jgi:soluble lytic murein transglycosylase